MYLATSAVFCILIFCITTQISGQIPYSYASGRDLEAVNRRFNAFREARNRGASTEELQGICGPLRLNSLTQNYCTTKVGRPKDSETASCDVFCCLGGQKTGNCQTKVGVNVNAAQVAAVLAGGSTTAETILSTVTSLPLLAASCRCLNDDLDVKCGLDGSFLGIRCPDNSACWRKCCRSGRSGGRCRGFLRLKCKCN